MAAKALPLLVMIVVVVVVANGSPIKMEDEDDGNNVSSEMFRALKNVMSTLGDNNNNNNNRGKNNNETKPHLRHLHDMDVESSSSFAFAPLEMRKLIESKMMGAELPPPSEKPVTKKEEVKGEEKGDDELDLEEKKEKEMKMAEQIGCSMSGDCNGTSYCNKLSYTCALCHDDGELCTKQDECCKGFHCDTDAMKCLKRKGQSGERCTSAEECGGELCCALNDNGEGECQEYLKEGAECGSDPFTSFFTSQSLFSRDQGNGDLPNRCSCQQHLKCEKKSSFLFIDSPVCTKRMEETKVAKKSKDHKSIIKITLRSSPIMRLRGDDDDPLSSLLSPSLMSMMKKPHSNPLSSLLPPALMKMIHKPLKGRKFTMKISSKKTPRKSSTSLRKSSSSRKSSSLSLPFFPFHFTNPFDDIQEDMTSSSDVKRETSDDEIHRRSLEEEEEEKDKKEEKKKMVDLVAEEARASVHKAVDGIFDTIMKKITDIKKH